LSFRVFITSLLKRFAPGVLSAGRRIKKKIRHKQLLEQKESRGSISYERLLSDLRAMGIKEGDSIIVHSSLSKIGYVEGGAETVVDVLLAAVGESGNVLMPSFAHETFSKYYLDTDPVFDVRNSASGAGAITESFRKRKGVRRSLHPTDSVAASGPLAEYFTSGHFGEISPYTKNSPYFRLAEKEGKILNIGVPLNTSCTNMHTLEDAVDFKFPVYHKQVYTARLIDENGKMQTMKTKVHDPVFSKKRKPDELVPLFEKEGALSHHKFGDANVMLVDAAVLFRIMIKNYNEHGVTMYTPKGS
jgi:aminoglycoside 3-N-acetyltransferase